ncbi:hypothetical protein RJ639_010259 [Escallonia herrerae]|uniref:MATH domain-containing protein n=1 Tax=Escallonia herrerae TaxID=1293975 RepID=A0AA88VWX3_9ASTE|nr:hypothetical protein RJ639_010259 [Escallonia herrerae]
MGKFTTSTRKDPPAHYSLRLEPLSLFLFSKTNKFDSGVFEAARHNWRLCFFTDSNSRNRGARSIGLGLEIAETGLLRTGWDVVIICKMFVYNKETREYIVFEDTSYPDGRRFHARSEEWVFEQLIPVDTLADLSCEYNDNDSFEFGVEIRLPKYDDKGEKLILTEDLGDNLIQWKIPSLAALDANKENSSEMKEIGGHDWKLSIYPKGDGKVRRQQCLSMFLGLANTDSLPAGRKMYVEYKLRIKNKRGDKDHEKEGHEWLSEKVTKMGFSDFIEVGHIYDDSKGWLFNNGMDIEGEIKIISSCGDLR